MFLLMADSDGEDILLGSLGLERGVAHLQAYETSARERPLTSLRPATVANFARPGQFPTQAGVVSTRSGPHQVPEFRGIYGPVQGEDESEGADTLVV